MSFVGKYGATVIPEEVKQPDSKPSDRNEETQPDSPKEDPDKIRGEVFKRMFPYIPQKPSE
jgi:hypothetical protein